MKRALLLAILLSSHLSAFAQTSSYGKIVFWTRINSPTNGSNFPAPATVNVTGEVFTPAGYNFVVTNLSLFSNDALIASQSGPATTFAFSTPSLPGGSYTLYTVAKGSWDLNEQGWAAVSASVNITVGPGPKTSSDGKIIFKTLGIPKADGTGTYNVPLRDYSSGAGLGLHSGGATIGLFLPGSSVPFATSVMGTSAANIVLCPHTRLANRYRARLRAWVSSQYHRPCLDRFMAGGDRLSSRR